MKKLLPSSLITLLLFVSLFIPSFLAAQNVGRVVLLNKRPSGGPTITLNPNFVNNFSNVSGTASQAQIISVIWTGLTANISTGCPSGFEASLNGTSYSQFLNISFGTGSGTQTYYVRVAASTAAGSYSGNVTFSSTGATTVNLPVQAAVSASGGSPTISANPSSPTNTNLGSTPVGTPGNTSSSIVQGSNLTTNITATAGAGVEVSNDGGQTFGSSKIITQSGGSVVNFVLVFRLTGATIGNPSGNIVLSSTGATSVNIPYSGSVTSTTEIDSLVFRMALNRTPLNTPDYPDASWDTPYGVQTFTDGRNWRQISITPIPANFTQQNAHSSSSTGGISNSTVVPSNVGLGSWFSWDGGASAWPRTTIADTNIRIDHLDPTRWYTIKVYCTNKAVGSCGQPQYVCIGVVDSTTGNQRLDTSAYIDSRLNTNVISQYLNKRPNANGQIWLTVHAPAGGTTANCKPYGLLNTFDVVQQVNYLVAANFIHNNEFLVQSGVIKYFQEESKIETSQEENVPVRGDIYYNPFGSSLIGNSEPTLTNK